MIAQKPLVSVKGSVIICGLTCCFSVVLVYDVSSVEFCDIIFLIFLMHACQWYECLMHCVQLYQGIIYSILHLS